ncbi:PBECR2 nuclease fold domain-containing protein [Shinella sp. BYT-45]|uniref:PBECR2 nuclease fold domain-containing protein n=1 Tax=Shinella sp. BYT-45 TaxID=3377377 RepID=UPI00397F4D06
MADGIPFQEAIDFLAGKVLLPTRRSDDLQHAAQVRGYSVAGVVRDDMLADFFAATLKARRDGTGFNEFRKDFDAIVERTGWQFFSHGKTEEERRAWRAQIIYTTNMRTSYMAGRYSQLTDPDVLRYRPYWQYVHSGALHPRKLHLSWNGMVLLATDPAWKVMYPPNGWGCGCDVEALSERELRALGKTGPDPSPDLQPYDDTDPRTGQPETRYPGIDRGWAYNVGEEWLSGLVPRELRKPLPPFGETAPQADLPPMPEPTRMPAGMVLPANQPDQFYIDAFLKPFGLKGDRGYFRDASGGIVTISQSLFEQRDHDGNVLRTKAGKFGRGRYAALMAETIKAPDEIWLDWAKTAAGAVVLRRSYLRNVILDNGQSIFVRFEWTKAGWIAITGFDARESYIRKWRRGALLYARKG